MRPSDESPLDEAEIARIRSALARIPAVDREIWLKVGMGLHDRTGRDGPGFELWDRWAQTCPEKYNPTDQRRTWDSFHPRDDEITIASVFGLAKDRGWVDTHGENPFPSPLSEPPWPVLDGAALYGLAGDIVKTIDPYTEADQVAVLLNVLTAFGNCITYKESTPRFGGRGSV